MSLKTYSLRSCKGAAIPQDKYVQTTIDFHKRKRSDRMLKSHQAPNTDEINQDLSPSKRSKNKQDTPLSSAKKATPTRSARRRLPRQPSSVYSPCSIPLNKSGDVSTPKSLGRRLQYPESPASEVKRSLHGSQVSALLCRDDQFAKIRSFIHSGLRDGRASGALYVSGPPGTGKTACLNAVLDESCDIIDHTHVVSVNCMSVKQPQVIYSRIACELLGSKVSQTKTIPTLQSELVQYITKHKTLIVLDEVDQLDCRGQEVLYTIFEWPALKNSKLLLIGIANALDLTDRVLPRLQSHVRCKPELLHFPPYTKEQIALIVQSRLGSEDTLLAPTAVQFCARKVAALHGDVRKALDICRRAIEMAEAKSLNKENETPPTQLCITLRHVADVITEVYGCGVGVGEFPLQQKLVVCTLLCLVRGRGRKECTLGKLYDSYAKVCSCRGLRAESESEFVSVCEMLESRGILATKTARDKRDSRVTLKLDEVELEHTLQDKLLISSVLKQGIPT